MNISSTSDNTDMVKTHKEDKIDLLTDKINILESRLNQMQEELQSYNSKIIFLVNEINELTYENKKNFSKKLIPHCKIDQNFRDGLILSDRLTAKNYFILSPKLPYNTYFEYPINGCGDILHLFFYGLTNSEFLVEFVDHDHIEKQIILSLSQIGPIDIIYNNFLGTKNIRFRAMNENSYIRLLLLSNGHNRNCNLAYYFS